MDETRRREIDEEDALDSRSIAITLTFTAIVIIAALFVFNMRAHGQL